jgi:hypothetical protein
MFAQQQKPTELPQSVERSEDNVEKLKSTLGNSLLSLDQLRPPEGLATGVETFDNFLLWRGVPKGDLSLLVGRPGTGATSLWLHTAEQVHKKNKWVAWINSSWSLLPQAGLAKRLNLNRLLVVEQPRETQKLFWVLQELITSSLFEMVGCHLPETFLKNHQLHKLKKLARLHQVALVLITHAKNWATNPATNPLFSLVIECGRDFFTVRRALHRPTPFTINGGGIHADLLPQLTKITRAALC